jgi:hypothetical protein
VKPKRSTKLTSLEANHLVEPAASSFAHSSDRRKDHHHAQHLERVYTACRNNTEVSLLLGAAALVRTLLVDRWTSIVVEGAAAPTRR